MKHLSWIAAALLVAMGMQVRADRPGTGCFERVYSTAHLAGHPGTIVKCLVQDIYQQEGGTKVAELLVTAANQGHVAITGHGGRQLLLCWSDGDRDVCAVECDAGLMEITKQDNKGLTFRTDTLWVGIRMSVAGRSIVLKCPDNQSVIE